MITVSHGGKGGKQRGAKLGRRKPTDMKREMDSCHMCELCLSSNNQV